MGVSGESESILFHSKLECSLASFSHKCDFLPNFFVIDGASSFYLASRLVARFHVVTADYELSVPVHHEVRVVASKYKLATALRIPDLPYDVRAHFAVDVVLR